MVEKPAAAENPPLQEAIEGAGQSAHTRPASKGEDKEWHHRAQCDRAPLGHLPQLDKVQHRREGHGDPDFGNQLRPPPALLYCHLRSPSLAPLWRFQTKTASRTRLTATLTDVPHASITWIGSDGS